MSGESVPQLQTLADLKGRKIALQKGSSAHYLLVRAVDKAGLQWSDIQPIYLAPADAEKPAAKPAPAGITAPSPAATAKAKVARRGKVWPFHPWNRAEAVRFKRMARRVLPTETIIEGQHTLDLDVLPRKTFDDDHDRP